MNAEELPDGHSDLLRHLPRGAQADLLRVLTSPSDVRADVIRQFRERGDVGMVEVLVDLEADEVARWNLIEWLRMEP